MPVATRNSPSSSPSKRRPSAAAAQGGAKASPWPSLLSGYSMTNIAILLYNVVGLLPFALMSGEMVKTTFPGIKVEDCASRGRPPCADALEFTVGRIYLQVICCLAFMYAALVTLPGKKGHLAAMGIIIATMAKHMLYDGLMPPPPVILMNLGVTAAILLAPGEWGKRALVAELAIIALNFSLAPLAILQDTFPAISEGSEAHKVGAFLLEVVVCYCLMSIPVITVANRAFGHALSLQAGLPLLAKHVIINHSGPPGPLIALYIVTVALAWYEVGWADLKPPAEKALKKGPMKLHATIVGTAFLPYFALETAGLSVPFVGLAHLDTSYVYSGSTAFLCGFATLWCAQNAYTEYYGKMEGKYFAIYHYFLSALCLFWQFQPTTSLLGVVFFMPPHAFTAWTIYILLTHGNTKAA